MNDASPDFNGPNYWSKATLGGVVGGSGRKGNNRGLASRIIISPNDRATIWSFYHQFTDVSVSIEQFITEITKHGFQVTVKAGGKQYEFAPDSDEYKSYYLRVLLGGVHDVIFEWIMFGYARVCILDDRKKKRYPFPEFTVLREGETEEYVEWDKHRRSFKMYYADSLMNNERGKKVPGGHVLVMNRPFDGRNEARINSRVGRAIGALCQLKQQWHNHTDATYYNAHPPFVISPEIDKTKRSAEEEIRMVETAESMISGTSEARKEIRARVLREEAEEDRWRSIHTNPGAANSSSRSSNNASTIPRGNPSLYIAGADTGSFGDASSTASATMEEPWMHGITLPRGHKMNSIPSAKGPDQFLNISEHLLHKVLRSVGIPPGKLGGGAAQKHAASVEMANAELATNVIMFHQYAEIILADFFQTLFQKIINSSVAEHVIEKGRELDEKYWAEQREAVSVEVKFRYNPIVTLEALILMREQGIITSIAMRDVALRLYGMPESYGEPDPDKALAKRQQQMMTAESKGKAVLEEAKAKFKPAPSGAAPNIKKRPASSSTTTSSSSSSSSNKNQK